jgi:hypothetical protein
MGHLAGSNIKINVIVAISARIEVTAHCLAGVGNEGKTTNICSSK